MVLDEADEMLSCGFGEAVETILSAVLRSDSCLGLAAANACKDTQNGLRTRKQQQVILFSATQPPWVEAVANKFLHKPLIVDAMQHKMHKSVMHMRKT